LDVVVLNLVDGADPAQDWQVRFQLRQKKIVIFDRQQKMKRVRTGSIKDLDRDLEEDRALKAAADSITLFVAVSPQQFEDLQSGKPAKPDPYSERFGLRASQVDAVRRGHAFMNWHPANISDPPEKLHQKQFMILKLLITAQGYMQLMEENILEKGDGSNHSREGYFRWKGPLVKSRSALVKGREQLLFTISEEYEMFE